MRTEVSWPGGGAVLDLPTDESGFWRGVAESFDGVPMPWKGDPAVPIEVSCPFGSCTLEARGRDEAWVDGVKRPSPAIFPASGSEGGIPGLSPSDYGEMYLTFASAESSGGRGSYKFYRFIPEAGAIAAEYGRIGQRSGFGAPRRVKEPYPTWMYWPKVKEKLLKGYRDQTRAYLDPDSREASAGEARTSPPRGASDSAALYAELVALAESEVARSLVQGTKVTRGQVRESKRLLYEMGRRKTVAAFNRQLLALLQVAPRAVATVGGQLAEREADFPAVLAREQSVVAAMEAVVADKGHRKRSDRPTSFDDFGVLAVVADEGDRARAVGLLSDRLKAKVSEVYSIDPRAQRKRFDAYCASRGISEKRLLWHGSPACNWASIIQNSLWVPGASGVAHGAMFGRGIYFGENGRGKGSTAEGGGEKSWGYVGACDSYWDRGRSRVAYMALFECAYGTPYHPSSPGSYTADFVDSLGADCLHARAGECGLANDEIVFFSSDAVCCRYLVRFGA